MGSETKDRFGMTEKRRAELLAQIPTIGQLIKDSAVREADYGRAAFLVDLYKVAVAVLSPPPLWVAVDALTAIWAAADRHPIESRFRAGSRFPDGTEWQPHQAAPDSDLEFRILPKPAPEPKWLSPEEAAVAFVCKRQAVRAREGNGSLRSCWMRWDDQSPRYVSKDGYNGMLRGAWHYFRSDCDLQFCIVHPGTGEPV